MNLNKPILETKSTEQYKRCTQAKAFGKWLTLKMQLRLHPQDEKELEKIVRGLNERMVDRKWEFYKGLDSDYQDIYLYSFLIHKSNNPRKI